VLDADLSLYADHYRAAETTFSMLTQVIGRSGRGESSGRAIIQTMTPEHSVLRLAALQDYDSFYDLEITLRLLQKAPPHGDVFTVMFVGIFEQQVFAAAALFRNMLADALRKPPFHTLQMQLLGPSPAAVSKINNAFRFRLTVNCVNSRTARQLISQTLQLFAKDKRSKGVAAYADINSYG
jgi:primosomal protein N' (replication factor Y)